MRFSQPTEISKYLTLVSSKNSRVVAMMPPDAVKKIYETMKCANRSRYDVASSIHVLDRIAAFGLLVENLDSLVHSFTYHPLRVSKTDAYIGAKAALLLGYPSLAVSFLSHIKSFSLHKVVSLASLIQAAGDDFFLPLSSIFVKELSERLCNNDQVHACASHELVKAVTALSLLSVGNEDTLSVTRALKKAGTELVRRIELYTISPHSAVDLMQTFSGLPPRPIHPLLLQAIQAFLLEKKRFKLLSRSELAVVLHASALSEIENIFLSREIVRHLVESVLPENEDSDPRTRLRIVSAISILKSFIPAPFVRSLTCDVSGIEWNASTFGTAFLNLAGSNGVCDESLRVLLKHAKINEVDLIDSAAFLLLQVLALLPKQRESCFVAAKNGDETAFIQTPLSALEITEKANPALPRNDVKKKRLLKRIEARADSMFDSVDKLVWNDFHVVECVKCTTSRSGRDIGGIHKTLLRCLTLLEENTSSSSQISFSDETTQAASDIMCSLCVLPLQELPYSTVKVVDRLTDLARKVLCVADPPRVKHEEEIKDVESSVLRQLTSLGLAPTASHVTNSHLRVSLVLF